MLKDNEMPYVIKRFAIISNHNEQQAKMNSQASALHFVVPSTPAIEIFHQQELHIIGGMYGQHFVSFTWDDGHPDTINDIVSIIRPNGDDSNTNNGPKQIGASLE